MDNNYDFLVILKHYVLQYIIEPKKIIYFCFISDNYRLICSSDVNMCNYFISRDDAILSQERIKNFFGLEFQIVEV